MQRYSKDFDSSLRSLVALYLMCRNVVDAQLNSKYRKYNQQIRKQGMENMGATNTWHSISSPVNYKEYLRVNRLPESNAIRWDIFKRFRYVLLFNDFTWHER